MARPRKVKLPVTLEVWLRVILRTKRPEDRMKIFREWRRSHLSAEFNREPTDQELEADIKLIRERLGDVASFPWGLGDALSDFVPEFHKANRRKKAHSAAVTRWAKANREKRAKNNKKILCGGFQPVIFASSISQPAPSII